ncbi:hypothetical protein [Halomarina litorea]|uniref:hypothetical protein n=1 Tax=Halomarina litorea TaxID=2961595 RepID=UPI0020C490EC|nr:hypothetical protein [Halomarina sp. BCD28]
MSGNQDPTSRLVVETFGTEDEIFGLELKYSLSDLRLFFPAGLIAFCVLLFGSAVTPVLGWVGAVAVLLGTGLFVYVTPAHKQPQNHLQDIVAFRRLPDTMSLFAADSDEQTDQITHLERVFPDGHAIRRDDGSMVAGLSIEPQSMALATESEWEAATQQFDKLLNTLSFATVTTSTGIPVDPSLITNDYADRLTDEDVRDNAELKRIIRTYQEAFPNEFEQRGTSVRRYQILVPVTVEEVLLQDREAMAKLADLPVIGGCFRILGAESNRLSEQEIIEEQQKTLTQRLADIKDGVLDLNGCSAERLTGDDLAASVEAFWTGRTMEYQTSGQYESRFEDTPADAGVVMSTGAPSKDSGTPPDDTDLEADTDTIGDIAVDGGHRGGSQ